MKITLPLVSPAFDDNRLSEEVKKDFDNGCQIYIYKDENSWAKWRITHLLYGLNTERIKEKSFNVWCRLKWFRNVC